MSVAQARMLAVLLLVLALWGGFAIGISFGLLVVSYFLLTMAYSLWQKIVLIDLLVLAGGFVSSCCRCIGRGVTISPWLPYLHHVAFSFRLRKTASLSCCCWKKIHRPSGYASRIIVRSFEPAVVIGYSGSTEYRIPYLPAATDPAMMLTIPLSCLACFGVVLFIVVIWAVALRRFCLRIDSF